MNETLLTRSFTRSLPQSWNAELVGQTIVQAFVTLDLLPMRVPRGPRSNWPQTILEWSDKVAWVGMDPIEKKMREEAANRPKIYPSSIAITQMEAAFDWLRELRVKDSGMALVVTSWALRTARGRSIKGLIIEKHWSPRTFWRKREKALEGLAMALNARGVQVF